VNMRMSDIMYGFAGAALPRSRQVQTEGKNLSDIQAFVRFYAMLKLEFYTFLLPYTVWEAFENKS